jgi:hypothetical protein
MYLTMSNGCFGLGVVRAFAFALEEALACVGGSIFEDSVADVDVISSTETSGADRGGGRG